MAFVAILGLLGALAARFGVDSRPAPREHDHRWADFGQARRNDGTDRELAAQLRSPRPLPPTATPLAIVPLDTAAFAAVGLRLETPRARAFAAALGQAAAEERAAGEGGWPGRAVDRLIHSVELAHLAEVVADLGFGRLAPTGGAAGSGANTALRALLTHLVRDRLQDALRVQAGLPAFWPWEERGAVVAPSEADESPAVDQAAA
jgi:hypothetical protein